MRRSLGLILTLLFLILAIPAHSEQAVDFDMPSSASALLMDAGSGKVLFEKNASQKTEVAGLKRLPALLTVCRAFDEGLIAGSTRVTVSSEAAAIRGTTAFLEPNETADAEPILKAAVMLTAGDAICALLKTVFTFVKSEDQKREVTVNAAPYAVDFYHKIGFLDLNTEQQTDGIRYTPMMIRL